MEKRASAKGTGTTAGQAPSPARVVDFFAAALLSIVLMLVLDALTNSIDIEKFQWDFQYYIALARDGFAARPLVSPFVYRYATPLLVKGLASLGLSIEGGFRLLAYLGAFLQLMGVFAFVHWFTRSRKAAWVTLLVTGLSLFHLKFLLFDVYRPDHFAYALILLAAWLAFQRRFAPLLLVTLAASQFREFTILPLIAYLCSFAWMNLDRRTFRIQAALSALGLALALGLPRLLLPVSQDFQFVNLSADGLLRGALAVFILPRDINFLYSILSYLLPLLMLASLPQIRAAFDALTLEVRRFLLVYTALVLLLSFFGGTDFPRFATFLFLPQILLVGALSGAVRNRSLLLMLASVAVFNLLWLPVPLGSVEEYRDFYGGYHTKVTAVTAWRIAEMALFILLGRLAELGAPHLPLKTGS